MIYRYPHAELAEALKASATVPRFAGPPRHLRGRTLVDAAVFEPVPTPSAVRDGCTHVLALCTRPVADVRGPGAEEAGPLRPLVAGVRGAVQQVGVGRGGSPGVGRGRGSCGGREARTRGSCSRWWQA